MVADQQTWFRKGIDWDESANSFKPWDEGGRVTPRPEFGNWEANPFIRG
jgi:hypothetical protein